MTITVIGIDLAKEVFQVHGVDVHSNVRLRKQLRRHQVAPFFTNLEPCLIGMEACGSAHHWARLFEQFGHTVKLMAPQFVKPYVKTMEQHAILSIHRTRQGFVKSRTAQANQIRGLLNEFGIVIPQRIRSIFHRLPTILEDHENCLPGSFRQLLQRLSDHLKELDQQVDELERQIKRWHRDHADSLKLEAIPGVGPITASAIVATIGQARDYQNGRQLAAWLGLVPK